MIFGITKRQLSGIIGLYGAFTIFYIVALGISQQEWTKRSLLESFVFEMPRVGLDYFTKLLVTAPIWYVLFRARRHWPLPRRLLLHAVGLPLYVLVWRLTYYGLSDLLGVGRMQGNSQVWDIYITGLFYCIQFGLFHAYEYYTNLRRQQQREAELRALALQSEISALKAQINPHFLYNTFNAISASVPPELEATREMLAQLADLFRYQLKASRSERVTVADELDFIQKYLSLEQARFGERLRVHYAVADDALTELIPPMLLQPLVENAVKHGISPLIEGGDVFINIEKQPGLVRFRITDTGKGLNGHRHRLFEGVGLNNTKLRIEKAFGQPLHITDNDPHGVIVTFDIPV